MMTVNRISSPTFGFEFESLVALKNHLKPLTVSDPDRNLFLPRVQPRYAGAGILKLRGWVGIDG